MNRIDRLVAIVLFLQSKKSISAQDVADHFNISLRTVYRDMKALGEAGVPIAAETGDGYSLAEGYSLPPVMFTKKEAGALFLGAKFIEKLTDVSMTKSAESALMKIQATLPLKTQEHLERLQESTELYLASPNAAPGFKNDTLASCQEAAINRQLIDMQYYSPSQDAWSRRKVEPLGLLFYARRWRLIAYCLLRNDYREFRTDRMKRIQLLDERFEPRPDYTLKGFIEAFEKVENQIEIKVKCDAKVVIRVRETFQYGLTDDIETENGAIITFVVPHISMALNSLLPFGAMVEVLHPASLQERLRKFAKSLLDLYPANNQNEL